MNRFFAALFFSLLALVSCKSTRVVTAVAAPPPAKTDASLAILDSLRAHSFQFEWLSAKAKVQVNNKGEKTDFTAHLRMKKDSAIWISISPALGVEVARLLMTKDSIGVIDRLNKKRFTRGYDFFNAYTSLPVNFFEFQNLVTGDPLLLKSGYEVRSRDSITELTLHHSATSDSLVISGNYLLLFQLIGDSTSTLSIQKSQFDGQYQPSFSLERKMIIRHRGEMTIEISFNRIRLNEPVKFPFKSED
jgi:hypothetical protein